MRKPSFRLVNFTLGYVNNVKILLHNVSHTITSKYKTICLEDLSVSSMTKSKNRKSKQDDLRCRYV